MECKELNNKINKNMNKFLLFVNNNNIHFKRRKEIMPFIGIISEENTENCIRREILEKLQLMESNVLFIKEKSIENIKNIKFETIIIAREFKKQETLKKLIKNVKYLIINSDIENNLNLLENLNTSVITYGFNTKATITASSVEKDEMLLCIQRTLQDKNGNNIEPQEIKIPINENVNCTMGISSLLLVYGKII